PDAMALAEHPCLAIPQSSQQGLLDITTGVYQQQQVTPPAFISASPDGKRTARLQYQPQQGRTTIATLLLNTPTELQSVPIEVFREPGLSSGIQCSPDGQPILSFNYASPTAKQYITLANTGGLGRLRRALVLPTGKQAGAAVFSGWSADGTQFAVQHWEQT